MSKVAEGITFTNVSAVSCLIPEFPTAISMEDASGNAVPSVTLRSPDNSGSSAQDFVDYGSAAAPANPNSPFAAVPTDGVTLSPGAQAAIVMYGLDFIGSGQSCLAGAVGYHLAVNLAGQTVLAAIPTSSAMASNGLDPAGSALFTCSALVVSPALTWSEAQAMVGAPPTLGPSQLWATAP